jgi:hypothetical protein
MSESGHFPHVLRRAIIVKRLALSLIAALTLAAFSTSIASADPPSLTGKWKVEQTGLNGTTSAVVTLNQSGDGFTGTSDNGNGFTGTFVDDSKINGKWHGPGGAGWLTVYASPNGHSFNGTWGYNGRPANGSFTGNKFLPPSPITAAGKWNVTAAGAKGALAGVMTCTQSGIAALCHVNGIVINGKFRSADKMRATWTSGTKSGWFSYWFNGDNNSFNGVWGYGKDSSPAAGRVVGQRSLT